jgi:superfamily II DNA/RNA helicase
MFKVSELTATSAEDVNEVFDNLERSLPAPDTTDLCFATSMVEVGLDVSRLGLMTVIGQPKSSSQYIQATGRVGRSDASPGLVVSVLKPTNARDLSHYEGFRFWHDRLYASVESASVTPFTTRALERSLPSFMAILLRSRSSSDRVADALQYWDEVCNVLYQRIGSNRALRNNAQQVLGVLYSQASSAVAATYSWDAWPKSGTGQPLMYRQEDSIPADRLGSPMWFVMNSMRSVEADAMLKVVLPEKAPTKPGKPGSGSVVTPDGDDF